MNGGVDYTHDAIFQLIYGVQPALEQVSLLTDLHDSSVNMVEYLRGRTQREPFPGFDTARERLSGQQAKLRSFEIGGQGPVSLEMLEEWFENFDVSRLRVLKLRIPTIHRGLGWLSSNALFKSLTTLVLGVNQALLQGSEVSDHDFSAAFIDSLPPLRAIRFICDIDEDIFQATLGRHGQSLRRLWFPRPVHEVMHSSSDIFFTPSRVADLSNHCPLLADLALTVQRSTGDPTEVAMYRSLGRLPRLQNLALTLDCEGFIGLGSGRR